MPFDPEKLIENYRRTAVPSFYQFDFLYCYVRHVQVTGNWTQPRRRVAASWLAMFLAHWGMFRGSSRLRDQNILFFDDLIGECLCSRSATLGPLVDVPFYRLSSFGAPDLDKSLEQTRDFLKSYDVSASDTLVSKIILGLLGNVPGYDRKVGEGLRRLTKRDAYPGPLNLTGKGLCALADYFGQKELKWPRIKCYGDSGYWLPRGRLVDMALFAYAPKKAKKQM